MGKVLAVIAMVSCITLLFPVALRLWSSKVKKRILFCGLIIYVIANTYLTIFGRLMASEFSVSFAPFQSYVGLYQTMQYGMSIGQNFLDIFIFSETGLPGMILNVLLYYPFGYLLSILFPRLKNWHVILIGCLCSIVTEATQYIFQMGWCETDDVIHNTFGTAIGVWVWFWQSKRLKPP